ncbi:MAG TPA: tetratricopeptide repeat protein [Sandaracinaceae bacterium LLY-WYZ-13_1]|nr:tetratricopeptide repeat protein [Sandaracinaceae bacterium LLY-WYZ-13_1]
MRSFGLEKARADGWLEQLGEGSEGFAQLCEVVGTRFVAFSVIAGIRITALTVDPRAPDASVVEFEIGDLPGSQRLSLGEFRERLAEAMLSDDEPPPALPEGEKPDSETLQSFLGFRYVLLAPLYGMRLQTLEVDDDGRARVTLDVEGERVTLPLPELRNAIREAVREEAARHRAPSPFAIDLSVVPEAREAAAAGDHEAVSELLGSWPGPLSMLLRTAEGQTLTPEVRATLAESLGMLGSSYVALGRVEWAQEVLRLGIQWAQDQLDVSADLFRRLGSAYVAQDRYGEAIGLFRRALGLGAPRAEVLPPLARSFLERGRHLAALLCAEEALAVGADADRVEDVRRRAREVLGDAWDRFRTRVPA